jgi:two-component system KDP operon response regulator KdpE
MSDSPATILLIEDEAPIRKFLRVVLDAQGYKLVESDTARLGLIEAAQCQPDVVLLDLGLPDGDGIDLTRRIREFSTVPIIVISARGREQDKIDALDAGADDYLTKPFGVGELMARLRVALRRRASRNTDGPDQTAYELFDLRVDFIARSVRLAGKPVHLTPNEYRLLTTLIRNEGRVLTHHHLLREVWGPGAQAESHYLRVYVNQLREKLADDRDAPRYIHTEVGIGYRFGTPPV